MFQGSSFWNGIVCELEVLSVYVMAERENVCGDMWFVRVKEDLSVKSD